ncbi:hypothetical protein [Halorarum salinum]|uniref:Uncharacterized protein n=1 Tax=Halorarum salinum TaxID=2743089 RepID=A0A7D5QCA1_9EURY|nr:hypothetical protein [Halobaculum salinum]QLG63198.1 hypothetical protein HUG12_16245 [Halobaculum salinum]
MEQYRNLELASILAAAFCFLYSLLAIGNIVMGVAAAAIILLLMRVLYIESALRELVAVEKARLERNGEWVPKREEN